jgi:hypothetical protein
MHGESPRSSSVIFVALKSGFKDATKHVYISLDGRALNEALRASLVRWGPRSSLAAALFPKICGDLRFANSFLTLQFCRVVPPCPLLLVCTSSLLKSSMRFSSILRTILFVAFFCHVTSADPASFWGAYPSCAVDRCLVPITTSSNCELTDNLCVCTNTTFVSEVAVCLGNKCPDLGDSVYSQYEGNCASNGGYTFALNKTQFLSESKTLTKVLQSWYSGYPTCAVNSCLVPLSASSECEIDDNACLCTTKTFVSAAAHCLGQKCPEVAGQVYTTMSSNCLGNGGYTLALSQSQWNEESNAQNAGTAALSSEPTITSSSVDPSSTDSTSSDPTASTSSDPTKTASSSSYTKGQKIELGVGIGIGLPALLVAIIGVCVQCSRIH